MAAAVPLRMRLLSVLRTACVVCLIIAGHWPVHASPAVTAGMRRSQVSFEQNGLDLDQTIVAPNIRFAWTFPPVLVQPTASDGGMTARPGISLSAGIAGPGRYRQGNAGWQVLPRDGVPLGADAVGFAGMALEWEGDPVGALFALGPAVAGQGYLYAAGSLSPAASYIAAGGLVRGEISVSTGGTLQPVLGIEAAGMPLGAVRDSLRSMNFVRHWGVDAGLRLAR